MIVMCYNNVTASTTKWYNKERMVGGKSRSSVTTKLSGLLIATGFFQIL